MSGAIDEGKTKNTFRAEVFGPVFFEYK